MDITVKDIVKTFKGIERAIIYSSSETDDFLTIIEAKKHWTLEEYKELYYEYYTQYKNVAIMDFMRICKIAKQYNFETNWEDYIYIIDNIDDKNKQVDYIDYYFWCHGAQLTEDYYKQLMEKPYFPFISKESRVRFLENNVKTDNSTQWIDNYFSQEEIKSWLDSDNVRFNIFIRNEKMNIDNQKIEQVKNFYNRYESCMTEKTKAVFFNEVVQRGSIELIAFLYVEKKVPVKDKMKMFWHLCGDTSIGNVVEVLTELRSMGMSFTRNDLKKTKKHTQWGYMEHTQALEVFFDGLEKEKNYKNLSKKLAQKNLTTVKDKTKKI